MWCCTAPGSTRPAPGSHFDFFELDFFALDLTDSFTVVLRLRLTVACLTNRPLTALRPRFLLLVMVFLLSSGRAV